MEKFIDFVRSNIIVIIFSILTLLFLSCSIYFYYKYSNVICTCTDNDDIAEKNNIYVDVKGAVKSPGVYEVSDDEIVNNIIDLAGGFKKDAYTKNINLSKKVEDELVIYVYSQKEYKKLNSNILTNCSSGDYDIGNCDNSGVSIITHGDETKIKNNTQNFGNNNGANNIVNINTATKEELMTVNGIGESKALSIISFREQNGLFTSIEQVKEVSGIGDSLYEKIKNYITI